MSDLHLLLSDVRFPRFLYGTAWKEERTQPLVELALQQGFRDIDTANQRRHYHEAAVGAAISNVVRQRLVSRDDIFLQSKFTFRAGQDDRLPYDPQASVAAQVEQSFTSSLLNLGVERLDSYLLHGPLRRVGLTPDDWEAWKTLEAIADRGGARILGVSNFNVEQLRRLLDGARVRPRFVQNRCYAVRGWDREMRAVCRENGIVYQGFSLLTANRELLQHADLVQIAKRHSRTVAQIVFRFAIDVGILPLTGTSDANHMRLDLEVFDFELAKNEIERIERLAL